MKLLSEAAESGLRAILWMAQEPEKLYKVKDVAAAVQAAPGYLIKAMQALAKAGILSGRRGSQGGFVLIRVPEELTALEVVNAIDPIERILTCPLRLAEHSAALCPLHQRMDQALAMIENSFAEVTIADLQQQAVRGLAKKSKKVACQQLCTAGTGTIR